jgi:flagellar assembly protein FliH
MSFVKIPTAAANAFVQTVLAHETADLAAQEAEIARRARQEVTKLRAAAEAEARDAGLRAAQAEMAPRQQALATATQALENAAAQLAAPFSRKENELAKLVTELAFRLAEHIIGLQPSGSAAMQLLVTGLLEEAAAARGPQQILQLRLNPADHAAIAPLITSPAVLLQADETIARGGAVAELNAPGGDPLDKMEWDARLQTRLAAIRAALGLAGEG